MFDDEGLYDSASPLCEYRIRPFVDEQPWETAMEELLAEVKLGYEVKNGKVVLVRKANTEL